MTPIRTIYVLRGSGEGALPIYRLAAQDLGRQMAARSMGGYWSDLGGCLMPMVGDRSVGVVAGGEVRFAAALLKTDTEVTFFFFSAHGEEVSERTTCGYLKEDT